MRVTPHLAMVMNLDRCIGCKACSVACKEAHSDRAGLAHAWFDHVETRPGEGYPSGWADQDRWKGGWELDTRGRLRVRAGGKLRRLVRAVETPSLRDYQVKDEFERAFSFSLPRICEHCINPSCVAACPSGAMHKRPLDGIVLVDEDRCRGARMCVAGCPYKKVYTDTETGKAAKCTMCHTRVSAGLETVCSESCVGRVRYLGVMLYDEDRVASAAAAGTYDGLMSVFVDPHSPEAADVPAEWLEAARRSPVYDLIMRHRVALPLHPEFRTLPMVWYVPPLSPVVDELTLAGYDGEDAGALFGAIEAMQIPVDYLASLFTAGDAAPVTHALRRLAAMRSYQRERNLGGQPDPQPALDDLYRALTTEDRHVVPVSAAAAEAELECSLPGGPGGPSEPVPVSIGRRP